MPLRLQKDGEVDYHSLWVEIFFDNGDHGKGHEVPDHKADDSSKEYDHDENLPF